MPFTITRSTPPVAQRIVVGIDHVRNCSLTSVMPTILVTTQKKLSLKYEYTIAPMHADIVANTGLMLRLARIGAEIDAAVCENGNLRYSIGKDCCYHCADYTVE